MAIIDISRKLYNGMPVFPGDTPFSYRLISAMKEGHGANIGEITMSTHGGTHLDAPFHFDPSGEKIHEINIEALIGKARVIELYGQKSIGPSHLRSFQLQETERLLIKTDSWKDKDTFPEQITYLEPELGPFLKKRGIHLVGVDVPSVDPLDSTQLPAHHALRKNGIYILESLDLQEVKEGMYELIALPLNIVEGDGSPVRAILRTIG